MTIDEAINITWGIGTSRAEPRPSPREALKRIEEQLASCGFNWLTGQEARRVLREACKRSTTPTHKRTMAKTTLTLDVEYDDRVTDPESLASAADRLLETVLSTPGIMEEYADPRFGEFFVAPAASNQPVPQPTVVVEVSGGALQTAYANAAVDVVLVDWDCDDCEPDADNGVFEAGGKAVHVAEMPVASIDEIVNTDTEKALEAAGIDVLGEREADKQAGKPGKTHRVEYYRLWAGNAGDSGTWDTDFIDIPADTPDDKLDNAIRKAAAKINWREEPPVIVGHYCDADELGDEDDGRETAIHDLLAKAEAAGLKAEDIDEIVHELTASIAADINNSGMDGQIAYLIEQMDVQGATKQLDRLAAERSETTNQE